MLRSIVGLIIVVNHFLNVGRAIMLFCKANMLSKSTLINREENNVVSAPESIDVGTIILPKKPMAYKNAIRKMM